MPSLRTLDAVHRLNAPTRAAATRRRRLRKGLAVTFLLLGAAIAVPSGGSSTADAPASKTASDPAPAALRGRHVVRFVPTTSAPADAARVDVWNTAGTRLITCAPTYPGTSRTSSNDVSSTTGRTAVAVALTDAEMARITKHLGGQGDSSEGLLVTACL